MRTIIARKKELSEIKKKCATSCDVKRVQRSIFLLRAAVGRSDVNNNVCVLMQMAFLVCQSAKLSTTKLHLSHKFYCDILGMLAQFPPNRYCFTSISFTNCINKKPITNILSVKMHSVREISQ